MTRSVEELRQEFRAQPSAAGHDCRSAEGAGHRHRRRHPPQGVAATHQVGSIRFHQHQDFELGRLAKTARQRKSDAGDRGRHRYCSADLRLARGFPLPLLMIGAGLALSSKTVRERALEAAAPAADKASEMMGDAMEGAKSLQGDVREAASSARSQAASLANKAQDAAAGMVDDLSSRASQAAGTASDKLRTGIDAASELASDAVEFCQRHRYRRGEGGTRKGPPNDRR